ncbi:hypothetical protein N7456_006959 [Penicillium angulare]|uniref:Ankyrin n=1 Tax=Penicillium angulare TaxID=116970 RepID=A0A9W9KDD3_9EURO|nr:hypothetical protein N7456_006959 [Penicillium angulare]
MSDAPRVVVTLVRHGTFLYEGDKDYPDLTPLYLAVASPQGCVLDYDGPLRISASYAFPRICEFLLVRGASPNSLSKFGFSPMHLAVMKRLPYQYFSEIAAFDSQYMTAHKDFQGMVWETTSTLLRFGGDPNVQSANSRRHQCNPQCWRSVDCQHLGQRVLHFAAASGAPDVVSLLLQHGADPMMRDDQGYLPLYLALSHGDNSTVNRLMDEHENPTSLIVVQPTESTALHITCRFASVPGTLFLLRKGSDVNAIDSAGKTALHEVLSQTCPSIEREIIQTIEYLIEYGFEVKSKLPFIDGAVALGRKHALASVRQIFQPAFSNGLLGLMLDLPHDGFVRAIHSPPG